MTKNQGATGKISQMITMMMTTMIGMMVLVTLSEITRRERMKILTQIKVGLEPLKVQVIHLIFLLLMPIKGLIKLPLLQIRLVNQRLLSQVD